MLLWRADDASDYFVSTGIKLKGADTVMSKARFNAPIRKPFPGANNPVHSFLYVPQDVNEMYGKIKKNILRFNES